MCEVQHNKYVFLYENAGWISLHNKQRSGRVSLASYLLRSI